MRKFFKRGASLLLIPFTRWYLQKERTFERHNIEVKVWPGVFHPGLFYSTQFLADYLLSQQMNGQRVLELGCGSGFLSILCKLRGAEVVASDISNQAAKNARFNAHLNQVEIQIVRSDLFDQIPPQAFDWILINPPYYAREAKNEADYAWHCGKDFEYFRRLFQSLSSFLHTESRVLMVLTKGCDLNSIFSIAENHGLGFDLLQEKRVLFDGKDFLFQIKPRQHWPAMEV
jgi:release factor glutamine methyltransferase